MNEKTFNDVVNHMKTSGFVYQGSEIYGGLANTWDFGPLGIELKNNIKNANEALEQPFVQEQELAEKSQRLTELEALLNLNDNEIVLDATPEENQESRAASRQCGQEER